MKTKKCLGCKKYKYLKYFYKSKYGYFSPYCKKCDCKRLSVYRFKKYGTTNVRKIPNYVDTLRKSDKRYQKEKRKNNPKFKILENEMYFKKHPERRGISIKVYYALKSGKLKKSTCVVCGRKDTQAHHQDYKKPYDVIWLCPIHHKLIHQKKL